MTQVNLFKSRSRFASWHNPVPNWGPTRIDQGVDGTLSDKGFRAPFKCKILAAVNFTTGWEGGWIVAEILHGPYFGQAFYVAEGVKPVVTAGQVIPHGGIQIGIRAPNYFFKPPLFGNIECGWVAPNASEALARTLPGYSGDQSLQAITCGASFNRFIEECGGAPGHNNTSLTPDWAILPSALRKAMGV